MEAARETKILITSTSPVGFEDAIREGVSRAVSALRNVQGVTVKDMNVVIEGGNIAGYRVNMEATFVLEDDETGPIDQPEGLPIEADPVPLRAGEDGAVRVGGTRVTLDSVVAAFREGETAEGIKQRYPSLNLDDVYLVIGWYLRHRNQIDSYLARREGEAARLREEIEVYFDPAGVRDRLLARRGPRQTLQEADETVASRRVIRLAADEDFDNRAVRGVLLRDPNVDLVRVQDAGLSEADDPEVLEWAAREGRVLFSHDANTMAAHAYRRSKDHLTMPGLFVAPRDLRIGDLVEDMLLVATLSFEGEWEGQVRFLPL